ncbi:hypothetical protein PR048_030815 [Dryococelus australis]|uniref:Uncharacterized protein n=1 Tax=Dryococelus australis TaxID=614101 RepID=A0ABQ9GA03_9NEOP|nr:hypothetical protein PR048_030815 [Dryococelus australis]
MGVQAPGLTTRRPFWRHMRVRRRVGDTGYPRGNPSTSVNARHYLYLRQCGIYHNTRLVLAEADAANSTSVLHLVAHRLTVQSFPGFESRFKGTANRLHKKMFQGFQKCSVNKRGSRAAFTLKTSGRQFPSRLLRAARREGRWVGWGEGPTRRRKGEGRWGGGGEKQTGTERSHTRLVSRCTGACSVRTCEDERVCVCLCVCVCVVSGDGIVSRGGAPSVTSPTRTAGAEDGNTQGAVDLLASHQGELGSIPGRVTPGFSLVGTVSDDAAGQRVFSGVSPPRPFIPALLVSITLIGSQDLTHSSELGSPLVDDRPIMNAVKYRVGSSVIWANRMTGSSNTDTNRTGVLAVVDIGFVKTILCRNNKTNEHERHGFHVSEQLSCRCFNKPTAPVRKLQGSGAKGDTSAHFACLVVPTCKTPNWHDAQSFSRVNETVRVSRSIVRHESHMRKSVSDQAEDLTQFAWVGGEQANRSSTVALFPLWFSVVSTPYFLYALLMHLSRHPLPRHRILASTEVKRSLILRTSAIHASKMASLACKIFERRSPTSIWQLTSRHPRPLWANSKEGREANPPSLILHPSSLKTSSPSKVHTSLTLAGVRATRGLLTNFLPVTLWNLWKRASVNPWREQQPITKWFVCQQQPIVLPKEGDVSYLRYYLVSHHDFTYTAILQAQTSIRGLCSAASSGMIPTCENPVIRPRIEHGSPWWEASGLTAQPPRPQLSTCPMISLGINDLRVYLQESYVQICRCELRIDCLVLKRTATIGPESSRRCQDRADQCLNARMSRWGGWDIPEKTCRPASSFGTIPTCARIRELPTPLHMIFETGSRARRCRWSTGFIGDLPFPPFLQSGIAPYLPSFTRRQKEKPRALQMGPVVPDSMINPLPQVRNSRGGSHLAHHGRRVRCEIEPQLAANSSEILHIAIDFKRPPY